MTTGLRFVGYQEIGGAPNIIVDGYGTEGTVLVLSHWPGAGCPPELAADLSTQIAFRYLDRPDAAVRAEAVSNNHFDEDGLCGIYAVLNPADALRRREQLVDVASAGDFGVFRSRDAARVAMALMAYADEERSPLSDALGGMPYPQQSAALYEDLLGRLPEMLDHPDRYVALWEEEDGRLGASIEATRTGAIRIEERPDIDLAIVTVPEAFGAVHPMAITNATRRMRVLTIQGRNYSLAYRYETWVVYVSEPVAPRVDLAPLAKLLDQDDPGWTSGDVDDLQPRLERKGGSALAPERFRALVEGFLTSAA